MPGVFLIGGLIGMLFTHGVGLEAYLRGETRSTKALQLNAIPLRSIAAGELCRSANRWGTRRLHDKPESCILEAPEGGVA
jgi:hypothetical protein